MREAKTRMPLESAFYIRTGQIIQQMKRRFGERRVKRGIRTGRVIQVGREIPFTLDQFREWLLQQLGGNHNGTCRCTFCPAVLDAINIGFDHLNPVSQGGSLGFENLTPCCDRCNRLKGRLTLETFKKLIAWLNAAGKSPQSMTLVDAMDIEKRLKGGGIFYKEKKPKAAAVPVPVQEEVF